MNGWTVPMTPSRVAGKIEFFRRYKFTLADRELHLAGLHDGEARRSDVRPLASRSMSAIRRRSSPSIPSSYIDFARFSDIKQMLEFVREVDNDRALYLKLLAAPYYRNNTIPDYARDERTLAFFDRIFAAAIAGVRAIGIQPR